MSTLQAIVRWILVENLLLSFFVGEGGNRGSSSDAEFPPEGKGLRTNIRKWGLELNSIPSVYF